MTVYLCSGKPWDNRAETKQQQLSSMHRYTDYDNWFLKTTIACAKAMQTCGYFSRKNYRKIKLVKDYLRHKREAYLEQLK